LKTLRSLEKIAVDANQILSALMGEKSKETLPKLGKTFLRAYRRNRTKDLFPLILVLYGKIYLIFTYCTCRP
jgi:hypothetical protein